MKKLLIIIIVFITYQVCVYPQFEFYQNYNKERKTVHQFISSNINLDSLMLDSAITYFQNSQSLPGIATLIIKDNKIIWSKNYGYRNLQLQLPVEDSTFFIIASISKTILATAVMQLWENGIIELEGDINDYLPNGFKVTNPYYPNNKITIKMLMTHTSSLQDNYDIIYYNWTCGDSPISLDTFLINYFTPVGSDYSKNNFYNYPPGKYWNYSNTGSCLLALIVENLSGKSYDEYIKDSIFTPLSMNHSSYFLSGLDTTKIAVPYMYQPPIPTCHIGAPYWPVSQLRTNKLEFANFVSAYLNGGIFKNNQILKSSTIEMMLKDQTGLYSPGGMKQGLIWYTDISTFNNVWGHAGGYFGASTMMFCNLQEKWGVLFFINWATININSKKEEYPENPPIPQMEQYAHLYGIVGIEDQVNQPSTFNLEQNYPNPFNPATSIQYAVPQTGSSQTSIGSKQFVTLKVFNILGKEIATLVNEEQKPGYYDVKWDASNQPSGVYFYRITIHSDRITSGNYVETKKMILLR